MASLPEEVSLVEVAVAKVSLFWKSFALIKRIVISIIALSCALALLVISPPLISFLSSSPPILKPHIANAANEITYYVSVNGRDSDGGNENAPFRTIQHAIDLAKPGDTIYVRGGTYHENINVKQSGNPANPIRLLAYPNETPVIDGQYTLPSGDVAGCSDVAPKHCFVYGPLVSLNGNHLEFSGFKIIRSHGRGIGVNPLSDQAFVTNILIDACAIDGTRNAAINIQDAKNVTVQNCDITHGADFATHSRSASHLNWPVIVNILRSDNITVKRSKIYESWGEGVAAGRDSTNVTIEDNIIYDNYALQVYVHRAQDVLVQRNLIYHTNASSFRRGGNPSDCIVINNEGGFMDSLVTERIQIINNVVTGCGRGIAVWGNAGLSILTRNVEITQNTVVNAVKNNSADPIGIFVNARVPLKSIVIQKNIVLQDVGHPAYMPSHSEISLDSNLWSSTPIDSAVSSTDHIGDPQLNNPNRELSPGEVKINWYKPTSSSPAIPRDIGPTEYLDEALLADSPPSSPPADTPNPNPTAPPPQPDSTKAVDIDQPDVFYAFDEAAGSSIHDKSSTQQAINLTIADPSSVTWSADGLSVNQPTIIHSSGSARALTNQCRQANEISVSLWVTPANVTQDGPARILSFSSNATNRNFMIGQGMWNSQPSELLTVRLRTTATDNNGEPSLETPVGSIQTKKHHIVYSRDQEGVVKFYIDGKLQLSETSPGSLNNWDDSYELLLANEASGDRPWLGTYHQLSIYCGALEEDDVVELFSRAENIQLPPLDRPNFFSTIYLPVVGQ